MDVVASSILPDRDGMMRAEIVEDDGEPFVGIRSPVFSQHLPDVFLLGALPEVMMGVPLTARMAKVLARIFSVFFTSGGWSNDHIRWVLAVVCGEHSSRNPSTVCLLMRGSFF